MNRQNHKVVPLSHCSDKAEVPTPAFVFDVRPVLRALARLQPLRHERGLRVLYSIKACPLVPLLDVVAPWVDGFSVSSCFEARLAREVLETAGTVHLTSPGLRAGDFAAVNATCNQVSFNSLSQWQRLRPLLEAGVRAGLRVNPQRSCVDDERYDPCRRHSKLGVPLSMLAGMKDEDLPEIDGLHFHNQCEARDYAPLYETVRHLQQQLPALFERIRWINLGGGYLLDDAIALTGLEETLAELRRRANLDVYIEPGKAVVADAGSLLAQVVDLFESDGRQVAVLDTSVNHLPELFEYQRVPTVAEARPDGAWRYLLAGGTCLAGDLLGEHRFDQPLQAGSIVTLCKVGAYSLVKAQRFNGHNLPSVYLRQMDGMLTPVKEYNYADYRQLWAAPAAPE